MDHLPSFEVISADLARTTPVAAEALALQTASVSDA
jgi:hypothetical protein